MFLLCVCVQIIGIAYCPSFSNQMGLYEEYLQVKKHFPDAVCCKCFAFEPSPHQVESADALKHLYVVSTSPKPVISLLTLVL